MRHFSMNICFHGDAVGLEKGFEGFTVHMVIITFLDINIKRDHFII